MGRLDLTTDMTGKMNQVDLNSTNISQIIDELNRNSDSLDAISKSLAVSNPGKVTLAIGGAGTSQSVSVPIGSAAPFSFLAFMARSDQPGKYYAMPYNFTTGAPSATMQMSTGAGLGQVFQSTQVQLSFGVDVASTYAGFPPTVTFYYYILNQPANPGS